MSKNDPQFLAQEAITEFINNLDANVRVGVLIFDQGVKQAVPLMLADEAGKPTLVESLQNINYTGQLTDSPAAVERAIYELRTNRREGAAQYIVFMTDGIVDTGKSEADVEKTKWLREELAVDAADNNIKVFAIAFTAHADFFLIQTLAKKTGGEYFRSLMPGDLGTVFAAVNEMLNVTPTVSIATTAPSVVVTPLPDEKLVAEPLADETSPQDPFLALTPDDLLVLTQISEQTGIPIEELAQELVGTNTQTTSLGAESGLPTSALNEALDEQDSIGIASVVLVAVVLLLLVVLVVWFVMRRRTVLPAAAVSSPRVSEQTAIPEAFINDVHGHTDNPATQLGRKPTMVGRIGGNDSEHLDYFVVNKGTVGRRHAIIKYKDFSFWLVDHGSMNGTFVNGDRISGEQQLTHGDKIRFHRYGFEFSQQEIDDGSHSAFADPNAAEATIIASAATLAATASRELAPSVEVTDGDELFDLEPQMADLAPPHAEAEAFAGSDIFHNTDESTLPAETENSAADDQDGDDLVMDEGEIAVFETSPLQVTSTRLDDFDEDAIGDEFNDDDEERGLEINRNVVGAEDLASLVLDGLPAQEFEDSDAEAFTFFEDIIVEPTPDDENSSMPEADEMFDIGGGVEQSTGEAELDVPNGLILEEFTETDPVDASATIPPGDPKSVSEEEGDVTLESFISTSEFEDGEATLTNEEETMLPDLVPDDAEANLMYEETVKLANREQFNKQNDDGSEDPTVLR
jgi:pSer/pThr/pTyr-binding forkhead associated (FHA) protein